MGSKVKYKATILWILFSALIWSLWILKLAGAI